MLAVAHFALRERRCEHRSGVVSAACLKAGAAYFE